MPDKDAILGFLGDLLAGGEPSIAPQEIVAGLLAREALGSTGIGGGVALPHCRLQGCRRVQGALLRLSEPVAFDSIDGTPVDLVFALLGPEDDRKGHLDALATVARCFNKASFAAGLRSATDPQAFYDAAIGLDPV